MTSTPVLFVRKDSVYKSMPDLDCFDAERDARTYQGSDSVVAHPPCRGWGRLRSFAKVRDDELDLAVFAIDTARRCGGVVEHPAGSVLWKFMNLPLPGEFSKHGFTLPLYQSWFGHPCPKNTWLYISGIDPKNIPAFPLQLGLPSGRVELQSHAAREKTPPAFAQWLVDLARTVGKTK